MLPDLLMTNDFEITEQSKGYNSTAIKRVVTRSQLADKDYRDQEQLFLKQ